MIYDVPALQLTLYYHLSYTLDLKRILVLRNYNFIITFIIRIVNYIN